MSSRRRRPSTSRVTPTREAGPHASRPAPLHRRVPAPRGGGAPRPRRPARDPRRRRLGDPVALRDVDRARRPRAPDLLGRGEDAAPAGRGRPGPGRHERRVRPGGPRARRRHEPGGAARAAARHGRRPAPARAQRAHRPAGRHPGPRPGHHPPSRTRAADARRAGAARDRRLLGQPGVGHEEAVRGRPGRRDRRRLGPRARAPRCGGRSASCCSSPPAARRGWTRSRVPALAEVARRTAPSPQRS